jgi:very-short-patch-repair endonuclease
MGIIKAIVCPILTKQKKIIREKRKLQVCSEETRKRISEALMGHKGYMAGKKHSEETKRKISLSAKGKPSYVRTLESLKKSSESHKNPSEEILNKMRKRQKSLWENDQYRQKQLTSIFKGQRVTPNKLEILLGDMLDSMYPNHWKFVGDGQVIINGKCPDFININGQKKIIELFGDYWHKDQDPQDRKDIFKPFGYKTLVIWESELKKRKSLVKCKIHRFMKEGKQGSIIK